ncbi:MAG: hypothetical protein K2O03_14190, partial [Lachnospiraceae bacterium]|nr:hypothetical protein [Lachnospiraceae bacterium]
PHTVRLQCKAWISFPESGFLQWPDTFLSRPEYFLGQVKYSTKRKIWIVGKTKPSSAQKGQLPAKDENQKIQGKDN